MPASVGPVTFDEEVTTVDETGGMDAPEHKTEEGFSYDTYVDAEPRTVTIEAVVEKPKYNQLSSLRDQDQPFPVTAGFASLGAAKLDDLQVNEEGTRPEHVEVTLTVTEVLQASTGTTTLTVTSADGSTKSGEGGGGAGVSDPTLQTSESQESSEDAGGMDPMGDVQGWLGWD